MIQSRDFEESTGVFSCPSSRREERREEEKKESGTASRFLKTGTELESKSANYGFDLSLFVIRASSLSADSFLQRQSSLRVEETSPLLIIARRAPPPRNFSFRGNIVVPWPGITQIFLLLFRSKPPARRRGSLLALETLSHFLTCKACRAATLSAGSRISLKLSSHSLPSFYFLRGRGYAETIIKL